MKVKIKKVPSCQNGGTSARGTQGLNTAQFPWPSPQGTSEPGVSVNKSIKAVPREDANLEAEGGETAMLPTKSGIPDHFNIVGPRHTQGGVPLNLPEDSFIFSDTKNMRIKDPLILAQFGITKTGAFTPAEIAKKYDINDQKQILADPDTDDIQRKTAEGLISNFNLKLAKLALLQESKKGMPQGIPKVAMPYMDQMKIDPSSFLHQSPQGGEQPTADDTQSSDIARYGKQVDYFQNGGGFLNGLLNALEAPQRAMMYVGTGLENLAEQAVTPNKPFSWEGKYEMPSETVHRNYPGHPFIEGLADVVADPFLIAGAAKSGARLAVKSIAKSAAEHTMELGQKSLLRNVSTEHAVMEILARSKVPVTPANAKIAEKSFEAAKAAHLNHTDGLTSLGKSTESAAVKAAGSEKMLQGAKAVGQGAKAVGQGVQQAAVYTGKKAVELTGKVGEAALEAAKGAAQFGKDAAAAAVDLANKAGDVTKQAVEVVSNPYTNPFVIPAVKNTVGQIGKVTYKNANEETNKKLEATQKAFDEYKKNPKPNQVPQDVQQTPQPIAESAYIDPYKIVYDKSGKNIMGYQNGKEWITESAYRHHYESLNPKNTNNTPVVHQPQIPSAYQAPSYSIMNNIPETHMTGMGDTTINVNDLKNLSKAQLDALEEQEKGGRKITYKKKEGGTIYLPKAQNGNKNLTPIQEEQLRRQNQSSTPVVQTAVGNPQPQSSNTVYNIWDEPTTTAVENAGYHVVPADKKFMNNKTTVGAQEPSQNPDKWDIDPEYGWIKPKGKTYGKEATDDFVNRHDEILKDYVSTDGATGVDAWKRDLKADGQSNNNRAMRYWVPKYNERLQASGATKNMIDENQAGAYIPGVNLFNKPGLKKIPAVAAQPKVVNTPTTTATHVGTPQVADGAPWWLQDIIKTAHAANNVMNIKKYNPWQATPEMYTPDFLFTDPTRELASNEEQSKSAIDTLAQFNGPQAFNSRASQINGQAGKNAADILSRYNNQNVGIYNQESAQNTGIKNQFSQNKAAQDTNLFDKYTITNQQFDNSKRQAKDALVNSFVQGITNANYTQGLNSINSNYHVNPLAGGRIDMVYANPNEMNGKLDPQHDLFSVSKQLVDAFPGLKSDPDKLAEYTMQMLGYNTNKSRNSYDEYGRTRTRNESMRDDFDNYMRGQRTQPSRESNY